MKVLIDIAHPAHVHFFRNASKALQLRGHSVLFTSRHKDIAISLLDSLDIPHIPLSRHSGGGLIPLAGELITRDMALYRHVRKHNPDIMAAIGGVNIAHVGRLTGIPSLVFYDTENARLQNAVTYPVASCVLVPECYEGWVPKRRHIRYPGYHELAYLRHSYFTPDRNIAIRNGLAPDRNNFFIRLVSWQANHDIGETGWNAPLLQCVTDTLSPLGKIHISSECHLPENLAHLRYRGDLKQVHHVMSYCRLFIGESATMASECAVLGVPAIYVAETGRGYTNEQERKYGLVRNVGRLSWDLIAPAIREIMDKPADYWTKARSRLLDDTIDVTAFIVDCLETFPAPLLRYQFGHSH